MHLTLTRRPLKVVHTQSRFCWGPRPMSRNTDISSFLKGSCRLPVSARRSSLMLAYNKALLRSVPLAIKSSILRNEYYLRLWPPHCLQGVQPFVRLVALRCPATLQHTKAPGSRWCMTVSVTSYRAS